MGRFRRTPARGVNVNGQLSAAKLQLGFAQQFHEAIHDTPPECASVERELGGVAKGRLDDELDRSALEPGAKGPQPGWIGYFAGGQHHATDRLRPVRDQVRGGEFDDAPDAAGAEVVMDDEELHNRQPLRLFVCGLEIACHQAGSRKFDTKHTLRMPAAHKRPRLAKP